MGLSAAPAPIESAESCTLEGNLSRLTGIPEASGIAAGRRAPNVLWAIHDSGQPIVYAVSDKGAITSRVRVTGAKVDDWEDISTGPCQGGTCLYIADIGDNNANRPSVTVYRVREPATTDEATSPAEVFQLTYPDKPQDAEALFVTSDGNLFIVTKGSTGPVAMYRATSAFTAGGSAKLERVKWSLPLGAGDKEKENDRQRVTDADASPDGKWVAIRTHDAAIVYRAGDFASGRESFRADLRPLREPQGEGVTIGSGGVMFVVGEGGGFGTFGRLRCTF